MPSNIIASLKRIGSKRKKVPSREVADVPNVDLAPHVEEGCGQIKFPISHTEEAKEKKARCYFTELPREIRDQIFSYIILSERTEEARGGIKPPSVGLDYTHFQAEDWEFPAAVTDWTISPLPRVCKLFQAEYRMSYLREAGIRFFVDVEHSAARPWARENDAIEYWRLPFLRWIRELTLVIRWRPDLAGESDKSTAGLIQAIRDMITPIEALELLNMCVLLPAAHLEIWHTLPAEQRIDLESLFSFKPNGVSLDYLRVTVRGYHPLHGQDVDHLLYERKERNVRMWQYEPFRDETGDWKGHLLYPHIWGEITSINRPSRGSGRTYVFGAYSKGIIYN